MAEFRENQQQHSLHTLGRHLNGWDTWRISHQYGKLDFIMAKMGQEFKKKSTICLI